MDKITSAGFYPDLRLPHHREAMRGLEIFTVPAGLSGRLIHLSNGSDKRLLMVLIAGVESLLYRYTGEAELLIATPVIGGVQEEGLNTVCLVRNSISAGMTWKEWILAVRKALTAAEEEQPPPCADQPSESGLKPEDLIRVGVSLANLQTRSYLSRIPCPMIFEWQREGEGLRGCVEYDTGLYHQTTVARLIRHLLTLLEELAGQPDRVVAAVEFLTDEERAELLDRFNPERGELTVHRTLVQAFEAQVERTPAYPALSFGGTTLTYGELNSRVNQLAHLLQTRGIARESAVALITEPSLETVVGVLGVLKAGGAFLPIDPAYPPDRIEFMLTDAGVSTVLTHRPSAGQMPAGYGGERIHLDSHLTYEGMAVTNPAVGVQAADLAYMIYTSGSTGQPKGVMIEHGSAVNAVFSQIRDMRMTDRDRVAKYMLPVFDPSVLETFAALLSGAELLVIPSEIRNDPVALRNWLETKEITVAFFPNAFAQIMLQQCQELNLRWMQGGGDVIKLIPRTRYPFTNAYGPTECTILATARMIPAEEEALLPTIGRPIANTEIYILDAERRLLPPSAVGEIYIGGRGVGRGYLNRPELTERHFLPNPFRPGERMYRTGDLGRWLPTGEIEFIGRMDTQVKIHGFRIEPGEIETLLQRHPRVREAAVLARESADGEKYLAAYLACSGEPRKSAEIGKSCRSEREPVSLQHVREECAGIEPGPTPEEFKGYLGRYLPQYMIPQVYIFLAALPRTAQGKIDFRALPEPERESGRAAYVAPRNGTESRLAAIWSEILRRERISAADDFFQLGGHSLNVAVLIAQIHREFQVELTYQDIFQTPVLGELAQLISRSGQSTYQPIRPIERRDYYPVSYGQKRLWFLQQLDPAAASYNMPERVQWAEPVEPALIRNVLTRLIARHESFRTYFTAVNGEPVQRILDTVELPFESIDLSGEEPERRLERREQIFLDESLRPFQLDRPPLFRIKVVKLGEREYDLIFTQHHIISDGWSMERLIREFFLLYQACRQGETAELPPLRVQYKEFAVWQNQMLASSPRMQAAKAFWAEMLREEITGLNLPFDYSSAHPADHRAAAYRFFLSGGVRDALKEYAAEQQTSLFTLLLAAYTLFLSRTTGEKEITVGIPMAGREHEDLQYVIGFFINTTVIRLTLEPGERFPAMLGRMSANLLRVLEYQSFPLELITDELRINYPAISAFFNMLNLGESGTEEEGAPEAYHLPAAADVKFDLVCYLKEYRNGLEIRCHYRTGCFKPATIEFLMGRYRRILEEIADDPGKPITQYGNMSQKRKLTL